MLTESSKADDLDAESIQGTPLYLFTTPGNRRKFFVDIFHETHGLGLQEEIFRQRNMMDNNVSFFRDIQDRRQPAISNTVRFENDSPGRDFELRLNSLENKQDKRRGRKAPELRVLRPATIIPAMLGSKADEVLMGQLHFSSQVRSY